MSDDPGSGGGDPADFDAPVVALDNDRFALLLTDDETAMLCKLLGELSDMLTIEEPTGEVSSLLSRLFPVAHPDDPDAEAEYQRWMRSELIESKLAAFKIVTGALDDDTPLDEGGMVAFMQSINSIRLVLGSMLQVSDEPDAPEVMPGFENSKEYHLYGYLSWLLEWSVQALSGAPEIGQ